MKFVIFAILLFISQSSEDAFLAITSVTLMEGDTLQNYYTFNTTGVPTKCEVRYAENDQNVTTTLSLVQSRFISNTSKKDDEFAARITPLYRNICGFTFSNYTHSDPDNFTLTMEYTENGNLLLKNETFKVVVNDDSTSSYTIKVVNLNEGATVEISCGNRGSGISCGLYHPTGRIILSGVKKCDYKFGYPNPLVTIDDIGTWKCIQASRNTMREAIHYTTLILPTPAKMVTWYRTSDGYGQIGCQYLPEHKPKHQETKIAPTTCLMTRPDKDVFMISEDAGVIDRYTTVGTIYEDYICQIEFPLPIQPNEGGTWKCMIDGHLSYVLANHETSVNVNPTKFREIVQLHQNKEIFCEVDYSSDDCYITSPQGVIYSGGSKTNEGKCIYIIGSVQETDLGEWRCQFAHSVVSQYETVIIELVLIDQFDVVTPHIEVATGDEITLLCHAQMSVLNCAFVDPHGVTYHIIPDKKMTYFKYTGQGFINGDCGITMSNAKARDTGEWQCLVKLNTKDKLMQSKIYTGKLKVLIGLSDGLSMGATVGISVGVVVAIVAVIVPVGYRKWQEKKRQAEDNNQVDDHQMNERSCLNNVPSDINNDGQTNVAFIGI